MIFSFFLLIFKDKISKLFVNYLFSQESSVEDRIFWKQNLNENDCPISLDCYDQTLRQIEEKILRGDWYKHFKDPTKYYY